MKKKPKQLTESVFIQAPPERVWKLYDDPSEVARWAPNILSGEVEGGGPKKLGSKLRWTMKTAGKTQQLIEEVVAYEPPHKSTLRGSAMGMSYDMVLELSAEREGTMCKYTCVPTYHGVFRLLAPLGNYMNRKMVKDALVKLKATAER